MTEAMNGDYVRQMARAEELKALAVRAQNPTARVFYLQLANAFRHLAEVTAARPPERPHGVRLER
ncbi:MAG TPA: hypothetical protein VG841_15090 [Caulobacterales bacterium]|nr:hypothetical protein [Caulobacterales bacterium]